MKQKKTSVLPCIVKSIIQKNEREKDRKKKIIGGKKKIIQRVHKIDTYIRNIEKKKRQSGWVGRYGLKKNISTNTGALTTDFICVSASSRTQCW